MSVFKMAWRNVWRNKRRTIVTVAAMTLALMAEIFHSSLVEGYMEVIMRNFLELEMGDIQIHAEGYSDDPSLYARIEDPDGLLEKLDAAGYQASARVLGTGLAAAGDMSSGVLFRGVDVERDAKVTAVGLHVIEGEWLDPGDSHGVVIGRKLAKTLAVKPDDEIVVLTQGADGSMANDIYVIRGILKNIGDAVDRSGVYMNQAALRELFVLPEGAHQVIVRKPAEIELDVAAARVREIAPDQDVKSWAEIMPTMASMLDSVRGILFTVYFVVFIAIGILILNAMLMAVFERIREFGVLKAIGMGPGRVMRLIIVESSILTALAIVAGCVLSIPLLYYTSTVGLNMSSMAGLSIYGLAMDPTWRTSVGVASYTGPIIALVLMVGIAILYPALKAALIRPVEAIRYQ